MPSQQKQEVQIQVQLHYTALHLPVIDLVTVDGYVTPALCGVYHGGHSVSLLKLPAGRDILPISTHSRQLKATVIS